MNYLPSVKSDRSIPPTTYTVKFRGGWFYLWAAAATAGLTSHFCSTNNAGRAPAVQTTKAGEELLALKFQLIGCFSENPGIQVIGIFRK